MGGLAGFALGGLLGSLLFGGGFGRGFGFGLLELLLIGGGIFLLVQMLRRRRSAGDLAYAGAGAGSGAGTDPRWAPGGDPSRMSSAGTVTGGTAAEPPAAVVDLERGITHIRQMDSSFDTRAVEVLARQTFLEVQASIQARRLDGVRARLTPEMTAVLDGQVSDLRRARRTNRIERVDVRQTDVSEAWQESGWDFVTVRLGASLLDYTVDDGSGQVVEGSSMEPVEIEEFWTFSRPVGNHPWKLSAIQTS
jgi:predicted lipid-binding transport protein (Tim44 family)